MAIKQLSTAVPETLLTGRALSPREQDFVALAWDFLSGARPLRHELAEEWGLGDEDLALFHETTDDVEIAEAAAALGWQKQRWDAGFGWINGPVQHGGRGLPDSFDRLYRALEGAFEIPDMNPLRIGIGTVGPSLVRYGTPAQIAQFAVPLYGGQTVACQLFSEPAAGSDLAGVITRGARSDAGWVISGQKVWTSNAPFADWGMALVRTDSEAPKHRGLTMIMVPMRVPGVEVRRLKQLTGGSSFAEVFLNGVEVPAENVVGAEGEGWAVATATLAGERKAVGNRSHERIARAVDLLRELAERQGRFGDPLVREAWVRLYVRMVTVRLQQEKVESLPAEQQSGAERAMDKLFVAAAFQEIGECAAIILGPAFVADTGEWATFAWSRWLLGSLGYRIAGGTEEILKTMLAERVLRLPREGK